MKTNIVVLLLLVCRAAAGATPAFDPLAAIDRCNVVWDSPSENAHGSMPLGNGDVGVNAWMESTGNLVFYVSKTDAWDENARLCKIGRVRVKFDPPLDTKGKFRQELKLRDGVIQIDARIGGQPAKTLIWLDADQPVVRVEVESAVPTSCRAEVELWRTRKLPMNTQDEYGLGNGPNPKADSYHLTALPDVVAASAEGQVVWYHRNTQSVFPVCLEVQHLDSLKGRFVDPLLNRTFGASLRGADMVRDGDKAVKSRKPSKRHQLTVSVLAEQSNTPEAWLRDLERTERAALKVSFDESRRTTAAWWQAFWSRSWVFVGTSTGAASLSPPAELTQGYVLQRYMNACSGRGGSPIKFNGSIFTVEKQPGASPETPDGNPDWRCWGGPYWFQNTRLCYWPMLASGDFEMMEPWFRMYREALPLAKARMQAIYKFKDAASFQETMHFWGMPDNRDYGWGHPGPEPGNVCIHRYWSGGIELTAYMLDRYDYAPDNDFARETLVPLADAIIAFFDQYWPKRDAQGKRIFDPAQSLEALPWTVNPMPEIAGLRFVLPRLLALPQNVATEAQRSRWKRVLDELPPLPVAEVKGVKLLRPSAAYVPGSGNFSENPELYAVFPYRLFGVGRPGLEMARESYRQRVNHTNYGWCQDSIQAACLGLGDEAGSQVIARATSHRAYRFQAMWIGFDWIPDQNHGDNIATTLQCMLLQHDGKKLYILPAWPKKWDVSFKLHAPYDTTVEGVYKSGKLEQLKVSPPARMKDVILGCGVESRPTAANAPDLGYEFIKNAKFGVFVHYTVEYAHLPPGKREPAVWDLDAKADAFDVKAFADAIEGMGAQYVTLTSFHAAMYLLAPSKVMVESGLGKHQAKRDLIGELADELNRRGIALCLYVHPTDQHDLSREERALFGWGPEVNGLPGPKLGLWPNPKWDAFVLGLFKEISLRYGKRVSGYWIDRHTPKRFAHAERIAAALRAGNPEAVIWQSGPDYVQDGLSLESAWPAAEGGDPSHGEKDQCCILPTDNAWFLGKEVRIPAAEVFRGVVRCAGCPGQKGGVHIALTPYADGYPPKVKQMMDEFGQLWRERKVSLLNTRPSAILPIEHKTVPWEVVATDSADNSIVYVHVTIPPDGKTLRVPSLRDGRKVLVASLLLGGREVETRQSDEELELSLPADANWDPVDTVIALKVGPAFDPGVILSESATLQISSASGWDRPENHPRLFSGERLEYAFHTAPEKNPWAKIDLGAVRSVRVVEIENRPGEEQRIKGFRMSISEDGQTWREVWQAKRWASSWRVRLTRSPAGVDVPGPKARFIKLETRGESPRELVLTRVTVFGQK